MSTPPITVTARLKAKPGLERQLAQELLALVPLSRADAGCLSYDLHQSLDDPACFLFYENWQSRPLLDAHLQTPHVQSLLAKVGLWLSDSPQIVLWNKTS
jgi:quinol monooxygenase YgiN